MAASNQTSPEFTEYFNLASEIETIQAIARGLRRAMQEMGSSGDLETLTRFPRECCDHASRMLLLLFYERGIHGFLLMNGMRPGGIPTDARHEWVQRDGLVVDITADQFPGEHMPPVFIGNSPWHAKLAPEPQREDGLHDDIFYFKQLTQIYQRVMATGHLDLA